MDNVQAFLVGAMAASTQGLIVLAFVLWRARVTRTERPWSRKAEGIGRRTGKGNGSGRRLTQAGWQS